MSLISMSLISICLWYLYVSDLLSACLWCLCLWCLKVDKNVGQSEKKIKESIAIFQKLTVYYECLVDPVKREQYDATGQLPSSKGTNLFKN